MALSKKAESSIRQIDNLIDEASRPDKMTAEEAIEFYEEIAADLEGKIEAIKNENNL